MDDFATRLRAAAKKLSLSDAEIARRLGVSQQRFTHYRTGKRKPDFTMLVRICQILAVRPDELFGFNDVAEETPSDILRQRIVAATAAMDEDALKRAAAVMDALVATGPAIERH